MLKKILKKKRYIQIQPGNLSYANNLYRFGVETDSSQLFDSILHSVDKYRTSNDFIETLNLKIVEGRPFNREIESDSTISFILNETALKSFNIENIPIHFAANNDNKLKGSFWLYRQMPYYTDAFLQNNNTNKTVDFILSNLK